MPWYADMLLFIGLFFQVLQYLPTSLVHHKTQDFLKIAVKVGAKFVFTFKTHRLLLFL